MGIFRLLLFEPCPSLQKGVDLYCLSRFILWAVGVGFLLPCPIFWNADNQYLSLWCSYLLWTLPDRYCGRCRVRLFGLGGLWNFQTGKKQPSWCGTPIHNHQFLILFISSHRRGICNTTNHRISGYISSQNRWDPCSGWLFYWMYDKSFCE